MSTVTVTSQAKLNAALADPAATRIVIDAPSTKRLTLSTGRTDVRCGIGGESSVGSVYGSASVDWVSGSASVGSVYGSASVDRATGNAAIHMRGGTLRWASPTVAVWLHAPSQVTGGTVIDLTGLALTDLDQWRAHVGADHAINPTADRLIIEHVSSEDHLGEMDRDGQITIGCWHGTPSTLRALVAGHGWPSGCDADDREKYRPRILAFADLCDAQLKAWGGAA